MSLISFLRLLGEELLPLTVRETLARTAEAARRRMGPTDNPSHEGETCTTRALHGQSQPQTSLHRSIRVVTSLG